MESETFTQPESHAIPSRGLALPSRIVEEFAPHEVLLLIFSVLFSLIAIVACQRVTQWPEVLVNMLIASGLIVAISFWTTATATSVRARRWPRQFRLIYLFPVIPIYYMTSGLISFPLHGHDFDPMLIAVDHMMFGVNPTVWLFEHFPTWPWLTEYLMICYSAFYFLPLGLAIELYRRARKKDSLGHAIPFTIGGTRSGNRPEPVEQVIFIIVYGFLLSYLGYLLFPSIGPRFTLHNFLNLSKELPGLYLTEPLRNLLDRGEGVTPGMSLPNIILHVTRDAFPSGHTDITLLSILLAFKFRARLRWPIAIIGVSLIFSTIYLRFHYVVDLLGAAVLVVITLYTWEWVREWMLWLKARLVR
jgi:membrane-associated phospholipid phosphatase